MITDYGALQRAVADFLNRDDLTEQVPLFIALAEAQIARRLRKKTVIGTLPLDAAEVALPDDCAELRAIHPLTGLPGRDVPLAIVTPEVLAERRTRLVLTGIPRYAAVVDGRLLLAPPPAGPIEARVIYYQRLVPLSDAAPVNALLLEAPDLYLYGALTEAEAYLEHDARVPLWKAQFEEALDKLNIARDAAEFGASLRPQRLPVVF